MKNIIAFLISGLFIIGQLPVIHSQSGKSTILDDELIFYADVLVNADAPRHRIKANQIFYDGIREFLAIEGSFHLSLDSLKWISVQYPEDRSFRIISWQLNESENEYEYFGFIQFPSGEFRELRGSSHPDKDLTLAKLFPDAYIPQLIYRIKRIDTAGDHYYLLFGYAQLDRFTKMKTIDVLTMNEGMIQFGKPVFFSNENNENPKLRLVLKYSADAQASLVYNPGLDMIIYDHLIQRIGRIPGQGITFLPDGSYEGYQRGEDGQWVYVEKVYDQILDVAPRPKPLENNKSKDLFGRKKKN